MKTVHVRSKDEAAVGRNGERLFNVTSLDVFVYCMCEVETGSLSLSVLKTGRFALGSKNVHQPW